MRYVPPFGVSDPNAPYVNGDPTIGRQGSIPPAAVFENPQREIIAVIEKSLFTPTDANLQQLTVAVRSQRLNYAEDSGAANNISVAFDPPLGSYTRGLTLRVRINTTNTGAVRINAGAGNVPVRKMNGADVGEGELPAGALATLVFDGTVFQLSNFGGAGGEGGGDVFQVKVPYTVDSSTTPGLITANFLPPITEMTAGEMIAVKVMNTTVGPTNMVINGLPPIALMPNGGTMVLQGDIKANDVVIFFYDGTNLFFGPNPEINASITYTVGAGQQFTTFNAALDAIRRKTIGANGQVVFRLVPGIYQGPINVNHPSGDRITVMGTMIGATPTMGDFQRTGNSSGAQINDANFNLNMLRSRYGTEIRANGGIGLANSGPGVVRFHDLLVIGNQLPAGATWTESAISVGTLTSAFCQNVSVWGCQMGFVSSGGLNCNACWVSNVTMNAYLAASGSLWAEGCHGFGGGTGFACLHGTMWARRSSAQMNSAYGFITQYGAPAALWWCLSLGNGIDLTAQHASTLTAMIWPGHGGFGTTSPALNTVGNMNSIVMQVDTPPDYV